MYKLYCYFWLNSSFCGAVNFVQVIQSWECFALHSLGFQSFSLLFFFFPLISLVSLQPSLVTVEVRLGFIVPLSTSVTIQETSRSVTTY